MPQILHFDEEGFGWWTYQCASTPREFADLYMLPIWHPRVILSSLGMQISRLRGEWEPFKLPPGHSFDQPVVERFVGLDGKEYFPEKVEPK